MRFFYFILLTLFVLQGCGNNPTMASLEHVDSLIRKDKDSLASKEFKAIHINYDDEEETAYYNLLKTELLFRQRIILPNDSMIDKSINYYRKVDNPHELARAYYFKAQMNFWRKEYKEATFLFKSAESEIKKTKDYLLLSKIYLLLGTLNTKGGNPTGGLAYSKKGLTAAVDCDNKAQQAHCMMSICKVYAEMKMNDSALHYIYRATELIDYVDNTNKAIMLNSLAASIKSKDISKSKSYILKSLEYSKRPTSYQTLASIYLQLGQKDSCEYCLNKALSICNDISRKASILADLFKYKQQSGRFDEAAEISKQLFAARDSMSMKMRSDSIKEMQILHDAMLKEDEAQQRGNTFLYMVIAIGVATPAIAYILLGKFRRKADELELKQQEIDGYDNELKKFKYRINRLEKEKKDKQEKINRLEKQMKETEAKHLKAEEEKARQMAEMMEHGKKLADCIEKNMPTVAWSKKDLADFARYYNMVNPKFAEATAAEFSSLTDKQILFLILKDMGKADADIQQIMVLTDRGMNSCKTRLEKRKRNM